MCFPLYNDNYLKLQTFLLKNLQTLIEILLLILKSRASKYNLDLKIFLLSNVDFLKKIRFKYVIGNYKYFNFLF